jgi:hypothetical protein
MAIGMATSHRTKFRPAASQRTSVAAQAVQAQGLPAASAAPAPAPPTVASVAAQAVQGQGLPVASAALASAPPTVKLDATPTGPAQHGRGCNGQYVYWVCQPHLKAETVHRLKLKQPTAFTREQFAELMVRAHAALTTTIVETASFMELHVSGEYHHNCLVRADKQYRWKDIAAYLFEECHVSVNFGMNVKTWADGVIYGVVASDHKPPQMLDRSYLQWAATGAPSRFEDIVPKKWQADGFIRRSKVTAIGFLEICRHNNIRTEDEAWALATEQEEQGDKGLLTFLLESDVPAAIGKVKKVVGAKATLERAGNTRLQILRKYTLTAKCTCKRPSMVYDMMKDLLRKNGMDGPFQQQVIKSLVMGRCKKANFCIVGPTNCAKSFLFKSLLLIFKTYSRPDGGSYQLEDIVPAEVIFLNDFEYDDGAKKWLSWQYFKTLMEGGAYIKVGIPKCRGGNIDWMGTAPVFMTAPQKVALYRGNRLDAGETSQMDTRIHYMHMKYQFEEEDRIHADPCGYCGARLYLEGDVGPGHIAGPTSDGPSSSTAVLPISGSGSHASSAASPRHQPAPAKKARTAVDIVAELTALKELMDAGCIDPTEFDELRSKMLRGE